MGAGPMISMDVLGGFLMRMMMTYLTDVWKLSYTHAAGIINLWEGTATALPLVVAVVSDSFMGRTWVWILSNVSMSIGFGFLAMSAPPVLSRSTGTCKQYRPECIGHTQKALFYTALPVLGIAIAGYIYVMEEYCKNYLIGGAKTCVKMLLPISGLATGLLLSLLRSWTVRFAYQAIGSASFTLYILCCLPCILAVRKENPDLFNDQPTGSPLTTVVRVLVASFYKRRCRLAGARLYERTIPEKSTLSRTRTLRFLDKAAIILRNQTLEEQERNRWMLCTVTEVEETKIFIRMLPIWPSFVFCGLITAVGNTYFLEQASHLHIPKLGKLKLSPPIMLVIYDAAKLLLWGIGKCLTDKSPRRGIIIAMVFSILCCITAAKVEKKRLDVISSNNLVDKPNEQIPMSIYWMVPQYVLLAGLDGFLGLGVDKYFSRQIPRMFQEYLVYFTHAVSGVGIMCSVLSVFWVGKKSESGGNLNWFQDTLNKSRLDKYYYVLAALAVVNLVYFILIQRYFPYRKQEDTHNQEDDSTMQQVLNGVNDDVVKGCCC